MQEDVDVTTVVRSRRTFFSYVAIALLHGAVIIAFIQKHWEIATAVAAATRRDAQQTIADARFSAILSFGAVSLGILSWGIAAWRGETRVWGWVLVAAILSVYTLVELMML